jgi:hypothetical protein
VIGVITVRDARQMNGPGSGMSASIRRHWDMNSSSWPHFVCASRWLRATIFALFSRTAAILFRFRIIMLSRVAISRTPGSLVATVSVAAPGADAIGAAYGMAKAADDRLASAADPDVLNLSGAAILVETLAAKYGVDVTS